MHIEECRYMKPLLISAIVALGISSPALGQGADPSGTWLTQSQDTKVRIARCGGAYCGTIVSSTYQKDVNNQDPTKRDRPIVGLQMIYDLKPSADGLVGQLYNPQDGKTYTGKLKLTGQNTMQLSGCVFGGLICRSQTWTKVN